MTGWKEIALHYAIGYCVVVASSAVWYWPKAKSGGELMAYLGFQAAQAIAWPLIGIGQIFDMLLWLA